MDLFRMESPLMQKLALLFDLLILNVLTILLSLPIFTMGAAITALYDAVWRLKHDRGSMLKDYWRCFRENLKQSTVLFLLLAVVLVLLGYNILLLVGGQGGMHLMVLPMALGSLLWVTVAVWVFPLQSRFRDRVGNTLINALLCGLRFLPQTIAMAVLNMSPWALLVLVPDTFVKMGLVWSFFWFGLTAYWNICLLEKPLRILSGTKEVPSEAENPES